MDQVNDVIMNTPTYLHIHCKPSASTWIQSNRTYRLSLVLLNEMDQYDNTLLMQYSEQPLVIQCEVIHRSMVNNHQHGVSVSISERTKPVINLYTGTVTIDIVYHNTITSRYDSNNEYRLLVSVRPHPCSDIVLPYTTTPFKLVNHHKLDDCTSYHCIANITHAIPIVLLTSGTGVATTPNQLMLVSEVSGVYIGQRIWDSSLLLMRYIQQYNITDNQLICTNNNAGNGNAGWLIDKSIIELGAGTGLVSIYLYHILQLYSHQYNHTYTTNILVTDLPECMELLQYNVQQNTQLYNSSHNINITALPYEFNNVSHHQQLPIKQYDVIICSDLIYNSTFFDVLISSIQLLSHDHTRLLMSYRPRINSDTVDPLFFNQLYKHNYIMYVLHRYQNVYIILFSKTRLNDINVRNYKLPFQQ